MGTHSESSCPENPAERGALAHQAPRPWDHRQAGRSRRLKNTNSSSHFCPIQITFFKKLLSYYPPSSLQFVFPRSSFFFPIQHDITYLISPFVKVSVSQKALIFKNVKDSFFKEN